MLNLKVNFSNKRTITSFVYEIEQSVYALKKKTTKTCSNAARYIGESN